MSVSIHPFRFRVAFASVLALVILLGMTHGGTIQAQEATVTPVQTGSNLPSALNATINFSNVTFSTSPGGPDMAYFPTGTPEVFLRFDYVSIPAGAVLVRNWYRDGQPYITKSDVWNPAWGTSGRLTHISIYDYISGLTPGYYQVIVSLSGYPAAQILGQFVIAGYPVTSVPPSSTQAFSDLTVSTSPAGPALGSFPAGTPIISARWNYANIPIGAVVERDWYVNGVLVRSVQEAWSSYWGNTGRLTHIALYDYERGLPSGTWRLVVFLRDMPVVRAETTFAVGVSLPAPVFSNLTFSATAAGAPVYQFPAAIPQVFARWDYANPPAGATLVRQWFRNGVLWLDRREPFTPTGSGTQVLSIYDFQYGLLSGDYYVEISLAGVANSKVVGWFRIG
jgi:hypothetical protein